MSALSNLSLTRLSNISRCAPWTALLSRLLCMASPLSHKIYKSKSAVVSGVKHQGEIMRSIATFILFSLSQTVFSGSIFMVPGENWGFQFNSPKLVQQKGNTSATEFQFQASTEAGFIISGFVEPGSGKGSSSTECMKYYWALSSKNPSIQKDTVKVVAAEPFSVVTYLIEADHQGNKYIQPNANYYGYKDGNCIDFHISQAFLYNTAIDYSNLIEFGKSFGYHQ